MRSRKKRGREIEKKAKPYTLLCVIREVGSDGVSLSLPLKIQTQSKKGFEERERERGEEDGERER